jgi:hypothetical protein
MPTPNIPPESVSLSSIAGTTLGSRLIANTALVQGEYSFIIFLEDTVFTSLVGNHVGWEGATVYPTGLTLCGEFTEIQLASGRVLVYNKEGV